MVLEVLYHKGEMRVCDITEKILSTGGNMTVVINNLLKEEYIEKIPTPGDRRSYSVRITKKGEELISALFPGHLEILAQSMDGLTHEEKQEMIRLLKKMQKRMIEIQTNIADTIEENAVGLRTSQINKHAKSASDRYFQNKVDSIKDSYHHDWEKQKLDFVRNFLVSVWGGIPLPVLSLCGKGTQEIRYSKYLP